MSTPESSSNPPDAEPCYEATHLVPGGAIDLKHRTQPVELLFERIGLTTRDPAGTQSTSQSTTTPESPLRASKSTRPKDAVSNFCAKPLSSMRA